MEVHQLVTNGNKKKARWLRPKVCVDKMVTFVVIFFSFLYSVYKN